jgi:predicted dehydrogenase
MKPVRTAVMGLSAVGEAFVAAVVGDERFRLCAVGDPDALRLAAVRDREGVPGFGDFRSLIVEMAREGLDLLLVGAEPHESAELLPLAARHGVAVLHKAPFARTAGEARQIVAAFAAAARPLWVTRPLGFEKAYAALIEADAPPFSATVSVRATARDLAGWRGDSKRAGGGVLLYDAYEQVDLLATIMGPVEQVVAMTAFAARGLTARAYDTEDAVVMAMHFAGGRIGAVSAVRGAVDADWRAVLLGSGAEVELLPGRMKRSVAGGRPKATMVRTANRFAAQLTAVGDYLQGRTVAVPGSTGEDHVATVAIIEAAYLSARTGAPESPTRMLQ